MGERLPAPWVRWGYGLGGGLVVLGLVLMGVGAGSLLRSMTRGVKPVSFPGSATVELAAGVHTGFLDPRSTASASGFFVTVVDTLTGQGIPVQRVPGNVRVLGTRPLFQFQLLDDARVVITGITEGDAEMPVLLRDDSVAGSWRELIVGLLAGGLLGAAGVYVIWQVRRRAAAGNT